MKTDTVTFKAEYTDTFAGEANYCWVHRADVIVPRGLSNRAVARRIKAALGLTGVRGRSFWLADMWEFRPYGRATVAFAQVDY